MFAGSGKQREPFPDNESCLEAVGVLSVDDSDRPPDASLLRSETPSPDTDEGDQLLSVEAAQNLGRAGDNSPPPAQEGDPQPVRIRDRLFRYIRLTFGCICLALFASVIIAVRVMPDPLADNASEAWANAPAVPDLHCLNPVISSGIFADSSVPPNYVLVQAHVHQRHLDRWIYRHDLIGNRCWPNQINSTDPFMADQCDYELSSVWQTFEREPDPYAAPLAGSCNARQLTKQGIKHARALGLLLRQQYVATHGLLQSSCPRDSVGLECDQAQKNQITTQTEYDGLCGRLPSAKDFPPETVIDVAKAQPKRPFWLSLRMCNSSRLAELDDAATKAKLESDWWTSDVRKTAEKVAKAAHQDAPSREQYAEMLDNVEDCIVCHACHGMTDIPEPFYKKKKLFRQTDTLETKDRGWSLTHYRSLGIDEFREYCQMYYGYYFHVLHDRMAAAMAGAAGARKLYIQVTSDSQLTPQLYMLGLEEVADLRPPWGSTLVYELYRDKGSGVHYVRVIYNGRTMSVCNKAVHGLCPWDTFKATLEFFTPQKKQCPIFYELYQPLHLV